MTTLPQSHIRGYLRRDGRKGIRNHVAVAYMVECAHHVAREIVLNFRHQKWGGGVAGIGQVHLIGFPGCFPNAYAETMMEQLLTHPNVGAVVLVSLGCESMNKHHLAQFVADSGRPVHTVTIQETGGTRKSIGEATEWIVSTIKELERTKSVPMGIEELVIGTICGGSDGTSGITANPAVGRSFDLLIEQGATCIFEETGELVGCEYHMKNRAVTPELGEELVRCVAKAAHYYTVLGHGSFAVGNASGGLTTMEEKSLGAYAKSGASPIRGIIKPGEVPSQKGLGGGLYLLDVVPDGEPRFGFPNISDNAEIVELIACGCHLTLFTTGRGSVVGSALAPVIKVCANPETYDRMRDDMDINAGRILNGKATLDEVGREIYTSVIRVAEGARSLSEELGHQEFILGYKQFEPSGPACFPSDQRIAKVA
ncbi:MAG: UxaA family hydrolase [Candidatus Pacebacteria bacterium]|nr:UxaA family hydrolase [Candidatus Paceibacterota bacterium]